MHCEDTVRNDPLRARQTVMAFLARIETGKWAACRPSCSTSAKSSPISNALPEITILLVHPRQASGEYLRGFETWDQVDGALIRYLLTGPLHHLGLVELARPEADAPVRAFRFSSWAESLLAGQPPPGLREENARLQVDLQARMAIPRLTPRAVRYQLARFGEWLDPHGDIYRYQITPASLTRARGQGLTIMHLLKLLQAHAGTVAPSLTKSLARWDERGVEASFEQVTVLRLASPDLLAALRTSRAARFLGDPLGPTAILVKPGAEAKVMAVLAEMGYLGEIRSDKA